MRRVHLRALHFYRFLVDYVCATQHSSPNIESECALVPDEPAGRPKVLRHGDESLPDIAAEHAWQIGR